MAGAQGPQFRQDGGWPFVFKGVQLLIQPRRRQIRPCLGHRLPNLTDILCRMGKVENPQRIRTVVIHEPITSHSAPSSTAHTASARPSPRRWVSTSAA